MSGNLEQPSAAEVGPKRVIGYRPPTITHLGTVADLTQVIKEPGAADGTVFQGIDIGS